MSYKIRLFNFHMRFRAFRSETMKCFFKTFKRKKKTAAYFPPPLFLTCDQAFFFSGEAKKMKYQASFSPSLQTKREEGPPDCSRSTIFTIINNLKLLSFWMASRITNSTIFHIKRTLKVIIETFYFS